MGYDRPVPTPEEIKQWFDSYMTSQNSKAFHAAHRRAIQLSLLWICDHPHDGHNDICPVCFWEDDGQDDPYEDEVWAGPNGRLSLTEARRELSAALGLRQICDYHTFVRRRNEKRRREQ